MFSKVGRWVNYEELEASLSMPELFALYAEVLDAEIRHFKALAKAQGADVDLDFGGTSGKSTTSGAFEGMMDRITSREDRPTEEQQEAMKYRNMKLGYSTTNV